MGKGVRGFFGMMHTEVRAVVLPSPASNVPVTRKGVMSDMPKFYKNCPPYLESYLRYLELVENKAASTLEYRCHDIRDFFKFLRRREDGVPTPAEVAAGDIFVAAMPVETVAAVTQDDIEEYLEYLIQDRKVSRQTACRRKATSLRCFYDYLLKQQVDLDVVMLTNPVPSFEISEDMLPARPSRVLKPSELDKVLKAVEGIAATRDVAIILLIATTGLSSPDICKIRYEDYHDDHLIVNGRTIYLTEATQEAIQIYLHEFRDPLEDFLKDKTLFISRTLYKRLSPRGIQNALQKHFDRAGVDASARDLRYTAVVELLKNARNECERSYLAGYLGYTNLASLSRLPLPKTDSGDPVPQIMEDSWLNNLGKHS